MVRDSPNSTVVRNQEQNQVAETQNQSQLPEETAGPEQSQTTERVEPESQQPKLLLWRRLDFEEESDSCSQSATGADADSLPTHFRPFNSQEEYKLVKHTHRQLQHSGYYWGPMSMEKAHEILAHAPQGTFLIRDSGQPDVFFTLSYQSEHGPTSVRVQLNNLLFNLFGSHKTFPSFFALLACYTSSKLTKPYRKQRPEQLKQICRRAFIRTYGAERTDTIPKLSPEVNAYIHAYPYFT
ncbi:suppressor of cytokine signaling 1-like [Cololabis saira]|uniref:suppressor of cytokine signaling 1-like n=1 Tax=Cololabis saira TaxID=129043 RepID=UPI002AD2EC18|nr:suppressor of cytokine signaling 1-like [Cololabis saira]